MKSGLERKHQKDQPETDIQIKAKIKANSSPNDTKKDRKKMSLYKNQCKPCKQMERSVIANIVIEKDIRSILADSIRNIPFTADEKRLESAKAFVIRKTMYYVQKKWTASPVQGELLDLYKCRKPSLLLIPV